MIAPQHQSRFEGDSGIDIANHDLDIRFPDGERRTIALRLGAPFQKDGQWLIRSELEHLDPTEAPMSGADSLHAVLLGIRWMILRLETYERTGCRFFWAGTNEEFDFRTALATVDKRH